MKSGAAVPESIDDYLSVFSPAERKRLQQLRETIAKAAPNAKEAIKYGIPTFVLAGNLVHFGGYKHHIGFFPGASGRREFKQELSVYKGGKGTVQLPHEQPLPLGLIRAIVKFRVKESLARAAAKRLKKR